MRGIDEFYTPFDLALQMVSIPIGRPQLIADFASGDGELLSAASKRWQSARLVGTDVSRPALTALRRNVTGVESGLCNFLSERSRCQCLVLNKLAGKIDLVMLNPPFSCRGGKRVHVKTDYFDTSCGTALAFVLFAFEYLNASGEIVAILPAGSIGSEKDAEAWRQLSDVAAVKLVSRHDHRTFEICSPSTNVVHIQRNSRSERITRRASVSVATYTNTTPKYMLVLKRGTIQMHDVPQGITPLAHSTDLSNYRLVLNGHRTQAGASYVKGDFVAICRVGAPRKDKVVVHFSETEIAISDCIIALECRDKSSARLLHKNLLDHWPEVASLYGGTGAKYITVSKLSRFLEQLGFTVTPHKNAKAQMIRSITYR